MSLSSPPPELRVFLIPRIILWIVLTGLVLILIYKIHEILLLLVLSGLIATALYPPIAWLKERNLPKHLSILLFYFGFIVLAIGFLVMVGNILLEQGLQFLRQFPHYAESASRFLDQYSLPWDIGGLNASLRTHIPAILSNVAQMLFNSLTSLGAVLSSVMSVVTILVFTFFFSVDSRYFESMLLDLFPAERREHIQKLIRQIILDVGTYVRGQLTVMGLMGLITYLGLSIIGVPYAFVLGCIVFFLDIVPMVGPLIAASLGILVALGTDPGMAIWAALVYIVAQQLENYVFMPMILGKSVGLHPFWILFSILIGGTLFGVMGVVLAVPSALTIRILFRELRQSPIPAIPGPSRGMDEEAPGSH